MFNCQHESTQVPEMHSSEPIVSTLSLVPYSASDSEYENTENIAITNKTKGRKRVRNEKNWKKNIRKKNRLSGKEYFNTKNEIANEKSMKPPCPDKCRMKCNQRVTEEQRLKIHFEYWNANRSWDSKRQFVHSCIKTMPVVRQRKRDGTKGSKSVSHKFIFNFNHKEEVICKTFFLNTLSISDTFMRIALKNAGEAGLMTPDLRGKHIPANKLPSESLERIKNHISQFPVYESHHSRERTQRKYLGNHLNISTMYSLYVDECKKDKIKPDKMWIYSKVFNEDFNLSFHLSDNDTCDVCDKLDCNIKNEKNDEKLNEFKLQKEDHLKEASRRYKHKRQ